MQIRSGASLAHQHSSKSNAATGRPSAPAATHSDTEDFPRGADDKSVPHTEPMLFQPRNLCMTADVLRWFGGSRARSVGCGSMHEVVASNV